MRIDVKAINGQSIFLAESTREESGPLRVAGFFWHPGPGDCFNSSWRRACPACDLKVTRQWWTDDAAKASRFAQYLSDAAKAVIASPEGAKAIEAAAKPRIEIDWHESGFWFARPPRGAHAPLKEVGWSFCGDDPSFKSATKSAPWKAGLRLVWWSAASAQAAPFEANMTPSAKAALARMRGDVELSRKAADILGDLACPEGLAYKPFQNVGIRFGCGRKATLLGDEPGLGKTVQAIGVVNNTPEVRTVLVLCPKSVIGSWVNHIERWSTRKATVYTIADPPSTDTFSSFLSREGEVRWLVMNPAQATLAKGKPFMGIDWDAVVVDEAHEYKGSDNARPSGWRGSARSEAVLGDDGLWTRARLRLLLLTGTPILNNVTEAWPLFRACAPARWPTFWAFVKEQLREVSDGYGRQFFARDEDALQRALRESFMVRREKRDVLTELLPKVRVIRPIAATPEVAALLGWTPGMAENRQKVLAEAEAVQTLALACASTPEELRAAYEGMRKTLLSAPEAFEEASAARLELGRLKVPHTVKRVRELHEQRGKVLVFGHHKEVLDALQDQLDPGRRRSIRIDGDVDAGERQELVDAFQGDEKIRYAFLSIRAAGVGLTLTEASTVVFHEFDWTAAMMEQAEDRAHRIGQRGEVLIEYQVFDGTFDAHMVAVFTEKANLARAVLDTRNEAAPIATRELGAKAMDLSQLTVPEAKAGQPRKSPEELDEERKRFADEQRIARRSAGLPADIVAVPEAQKAAALQAMKFLADMDPDKAKEENDVGFSKSDVYVGHALSRRPTLNDAEATIAARLATIYRRQLGRELCLAAGGTWAK